MSNSQVSEAQTKQTSENKNEISLKLKIEQSEINENIYFLDNTKVNEEYHENQVEVKHNHDNLPELNENNTSLIINEEKLPFIKFFKPKNNNR